MRFVRTGWHGAPCAVCARAHHTHPRACPPAPSHAGPPCIRGRAKQRAEARPAADWWVGGRGGSGGGACSHAHTRTQTCTPQPSNACTSHARTHTGFLPHSSMAHMRMAPPSAWRGAAFAAAMEAPPAATPSSPYPPPPAVAIKEAHGFELQRHQFIREYDSHMLIYKHKKTGACGTQALLQHLGSVALSSSRSSSSSIRSSTRLLQQLGRGRPEVGSKHQLGSLHAPPPTRPPPAGAEVISVINDDENKTFGVVFRTPVGWGWRA